MNFKTDIRPITEFRNKAKEILAQVKSTKRPIVVTQRGQASAVLIDIDEYQRNMEQMEIMKMIAEGEKAIQEGDFKSHVDVMKDLDKWLEE